MDIRRALTLIENADPISNIRNDPAALRSLERVADIRSIANLLDCDFDDDEEAIDAFLDACHYTVQAIVERGSCPVFRHMRVENVNAYIVALEAGQGTLGKHWSVNPIDSPTWEQDHRGEHDIRLSGEIGLDQIDWWASIRQWFEYPSEWEPIFSGPVSGVRIEDEDTGKTYKCKNESYPIA